nr:immunoglobulin light chain junction region [Macaca mulatta]
CQMYISSPLTF